MSIFAKSGMFDNPKNFDFILQVEFFLLDYRN